MTKKFISIITNEDSRKRIQYIGVFIILGVVSLSMTIVNIFTHKGALTWATAAFAVLCLVNFLIVFKANRVGMTIASFLFMIEITGLFVFFIISGNPDGFSVVWIAMLPSCGMLLFGLKKTSIFSFVLFIMLIFFFWFPVGRQLLQYEYNKTFMMRFPILYVAFFAISSLLEAIRILTQKELDKLRAMYKDLSAHDNLTKLLNRQGLLDLVKSVKVDQNQTVYMIDIDHFKNVNDNYGHDVGDIVLEKVAELTEVECIEARTCRWGGEEFVVWFPVGGGDPEVLRQKMEKMDIGIPNCDKIINVTISIGVASGEGELIDLISRADVALYKAKQSGRNRVVLEEN